MQIFPCKSTRRKMWIVLMCLNKVLWVFFCAFKCQFLFIYFFIYGLHKDRMVKNTFEQDKILNFKVNIEQILMKRSRFLCLSGWGISSSSKSPEKRFFTILHLRKSVILSPYLLLLKIKFILLTHMRWHS